MNTSRAWLGIGVVDAAILIGLSLGRADTRVDRLAIRVDSLAVRFLILLFTLAWYVPLGAQEIETEVVAVLKGEDGNGFNRRSWPIAKWNSYWVVREEGPNIYLFDEAGNFAQKLGREGQGPMEWQSPTDAVVVGDSLYVHDSRNGRISVVGPDMQLVRDFQLQARPTDIDVAGGHLVLAATYFDRERAGRAAFFVQPTSDAPITGGFDTFDIIPIEGGIRGWRQIAVHGDNITTLSPDGLLRTFDSAGRLLHEVTTQKPDGWTVSILDREYAEKRGDGELFPSYVDEIIPASDDLVWVSTSWPRDDYRDRIRKEEWEGGSAYYLDFDGFQSRVDLIDPTNASIHESIDIDEYVVSLVDQGYIASTRYDDLDLLTITIRRLPEIRRDTP